MQRLSRHVEDRGVLKLIRRYLEAGMLREGLVSLRTQGTPQGGPLSPLLSNVLLTDLDRELERREARYADDCNIFVRSQEAGEHLMGWIVPWLEHTLQLRVNPDSRLRMGYFKLTEARTPLEEIDGWIRRRLRCLLWRQAKRVHGYTPEHAC